MRSKIQVEIDLSVPEELPGQLNELARGSFSAPLLTLPLPCVGAPGWTGSLCLLVCTCCPGPQLQLYVAFIL